MYGKSFESLYTGSMVGAGFHVFAVWNYVITNTHFSHIELNPKLLAYTLAGSESAESEVQAALDYLCAPDPKSRSQIEQGRRLVKEGQFLYRVVNWQDYQQIKTAEGLREYNRRKQAEYRARKKNKPNKKDLMRVRAQADSREKRFVAADGDGDMQSTNRITSEDLPNGL